MIFTKNVIFGKKSSFTIALKYIMRLTTNPILKPTKDMQILCEVNDFI